MELELLEKRWNMQILAFLLDKQPARFKELTKVCSREATLTFRVKELQKNGLIEATPINTRDEKYFAYKLTSRGSQIAQKIHEIKRI